MSFTSCNLITFFACLKDLRRDIRLARAWGLTLEEAKRLRKLPLLQIVLICHLSPLPIFTLRKTATVEDAELQSKSIRELWTRLALTIAHDRVLFETVFDDDHTLFADPLNDRQDLRFNVRFLDPTWILNNSEMAAFVPKRYYVGLEEPPRLPASLIQNEAFASLLDSEMTSSVVGTLLGLSTNLVIELRNLLTTPKPRHLNKGPQIRQIQRHRAEQFFLFEGVRRFMVFRQKGLMPSESFVRSVIHIQRLPIFQANHCPDIDFMTNLYWALVAFGSLKNEAMRSEEATKLAECITPVFKESLVRARRFKTIPIFEPVSFASTEQQSILQSVNAAITEGDFSRHRFIQLLWDIHHAKPH